MGTQCAGLMATNSGCICSPAIRSISFVWLLTSAKYYKLYATDLMLYFCNHQGQFDCTSRRRQNVIKKLHFHAILRMVLQQKLPFYNGRLSRSFSPGSTILLSSFIQAQKQLTKSRKSHPNKMLTMARCFHKLHLIWQNPTTSHELNSNRVDFFDFLRFWNAESLK